MAVTYFAIEQRILISLLAHFNIFFCRLDREKTFYGNQYGVEMGGADTQFNPQEVEAAMKAQKELKAASSLAEVTPKALALGILLAVLFAASSTYLGLKIARTISASIPAALVSVAILRRFRSSNILENNMVQTIASAGEATATGAVFILPALIILGHWESFDYWQTFLLTALGSLLGILFSVPLRRSLILKERLPFPEGQATAAVLKAGNDTQNGSLLTLLSAGTVSAVCAYAQQALKIGAEEIQYWGRVKSTTFGASLVLSPVLLAAGYIVGMKGVLSFGVGSVITWIIGIPSYIYLFGDLDQAADLTAIVNDLHRSHFRYVGVGTLAVGGIWSVIIMLRPIGQAMKVSLEALFATQETAVYLPREERDIPILYVSMGIFTSALLALMVFFIFLQSLNLDIKTSTFWFLVVFASIFVLFLALIGSALAAYIVGIVGTTSLPISGIGITCISAFASIVFFVLSKEIDFSVDTDAATKVAAVVIIFSVIVCISAALAGDNMQDLKAGHLVGATPANQQMMLVIGAIASALVLPLILEATFQTYGIADVFPREGMNKDHSLPAPQSTLLATVASGFFIGGLPHAMIGIGIVLGILAIIVDENLKRRGSKFSFPIMPFASGIYFPMGYITAFLIGGLIRHFTDRNEVDENHQGVLCASGLVAGEALMGAALTIFFAYSSTEVLAWNVDWIKRYEEVIGVAMFGLVCLYLYRQGKPLGSKPNPSAEKM